MNQLQAMRVFTRVVELTSFSLAGKQLGISAAAVTRSIGMLEAHLNTRLLNRNTRNLSLTDAGRDYLDGCRDIIDRLDTMESSLVQATRDLRGTLRIASVATYGHAGLAPLLAAYRALHDGVTFEVTTFEFDIDLIEGGFDVCFTDTPDLFGSTLVSRPLSRMREVVVATPTYLARHERPRNPSDLNHHALIGRSDGASRNWEFVDGEGAYRISAAGALTSNSYGMVRATALQHMGVALLPHATVEEDLQRGTLVPLLEQFDIGASQRHLSILYAAPAQLSMKVRSFVDFVVAQYRTPDRQTALRVVA
ncbi:LysR family transcriptional regulator [Paraburkholderia sp. Tr-20389]|uniref:LysR family transcriptional regulator n=1 Tax=Paraburkholderia sp. Tr-20389 TaxID=2703903 RepID=UPI00197E56FE|nr:LysR family transcriptional regulator [Paraburkholderia sp. Tr-20389]MBN3754738.1 LysR family transcriptional regulator [Paraburkholderia sp. Tr-20389]